MKRRVIPSTNKCLALFILLCGLMFCCACSSGEGAKTKEGLKAVESGDYVTAQTCFAQALQDGEDPVYLNRALGICSMGQNRYEDAESYFKEALASDGSIPGSVNYDINFYLGVCYYKLERYEEAKERFDAILELKSKNVDAYVERGTVLLALNQETEACEDFDRAVELAPKDYGLAIDIYCILRDAGKESKGAEYLQAAIDSQDKRMTDYDKGRFYFYLGDFSNARDYLEKAKGSGSSGEELILLLGQCYENLNDRTYALTVYQSYLATSQSKAVYNQMGMCYAAAGDYESALTAFQTGLSLSDVSFTRELRFNEIITYEKLGDAVKAKELCESYVADYPSDEAGVREYRFLKTR